MADTEKLTINMGGVELGKIDLLVEHSIYQSRTDFIRTAVRAQLEKHTMELEQVITRRAHVIGGMLIGKADLETRRRKGQKMTINVVGVLSLAEDIAPELASDVIKSVTVRGIFNASRSVKDALADRMH